MIGLSTAPTPVLPDTTTSTSGVEKYSDPLERTSTLTTLPANTTG